MKIIEIVCEKTTHFNSPDSSVFGFVTGYGYGFTGLRLRATAIGLLYKSI